MSFCETNIFIVIGDKPIGFISGFRESQSRVMTPIMGFGFSASWIPGPTTITLSADAVILDRSKSLGFDEKHDAFDVITIDRTSKADCCGFNVVKYNDCMFSSVKLESSFGRNDIMLQGATINCGNCSSHRGITREAWRLLKMVMPNGWSD